MITVDIIGGTKYQRSIAYKIIEHCHKALFPKIEKLYITVRLTNKIDVYGYCTELDNREFDVTLLGKKKDINKTENKPMLKLPKPLTKEFKKLGIIE